MKSKFVQIKILIYISYVRQESIHLMLLLSMFNNLASMRRTKNILREFLVLQLSQLCSNDGKDVN